MKREIHFAGRAICLDVIGPAAKNLVEFMFGLMPDKGNASPHITLTVEDCADNAEISFSIPDGESPAVRGSASQIVTRLLYKVDYHLANLCCEGLYLHAASVALDGQAVLMPAASGSGKSTLTTWLTQNGFQYMSDESTFIPVNSQNCCGFTRPAHLKIGSMNLFPNLDKIHKLEVRGEDGNLTGWSIATSILNPIPRAQAVPIRSIVIPKFNANAKFSYERISPARTAFELAGCLTNARNLEGHGFPEILRLARALPAWRLTYSDVGQVQAFLDHNKKME
jgi:hypothetical protein